MSPVIKKSSKEKKESAVSPVVGVMLMLVVTIIIAAVVAAFSTGVMTSTEKAPTAVLNVEIESSHYYDGGEYEGVAYRYTYPLMTIKEITGDKLDTGKMSITTSWKDESGKSHSHIYTSANTWTSTADPANYTNVAAMYYSSTEYWYPHNTKMFYGNWVMSPGDLIISAGQYIVYSGEASSPVAISADKSWKAIFGDDYTTLSKGTDVHVIITYDNTHVIYDKEVTIQ